LIFSSEQSNPSTFIWSITLSKVSDYILIVFQTQSDSLGGVKKFLEDTSIPLVENTREDFGVVGILPNQMTKNGSIDTSSLNDA